MKRPIAVWLIALSLSAVSLDSILGLPNILVSVDAMPKFLIALSHVLYSIAGIGVVIGIWRSLRWTWIAVILGGSASLGAAIGGPLAFGPIPPEFLRTAIAMAFAILLLTSALLWYVRKATRAAV
jgi:hypothetical protein